MTTRRSNPDLNNLLQRAFREGVLQPSPEAEASFDCERRAKEVRQASGIDIGVRGGSTFYLPCELLARDLSTLSNAAGAFTMSPAERPFLLPLLTPYSILANLNVTTLSGLVGNVGLPIVSSAQTSGFVAQNAVYTSGDMQFALPCVLTPHLLTTQLKVSRTLIYSAGMDIMNGVIREILSSMGAALDRAALLSDGTGSATKGVLATAGVNSTTFGAAAAYPALLAMQTPILATNPRRDSLAWITSNPAREKLMQKPRSATAGTGFCWDDNDRIGNWPAFPNTNLDTSNVIIAGDFSSLVFATWGSGRHRCDGGQHHRRVHKCGQSIRRGVGGFCGRQTGRV